MAVIAWLLPRTRRHIEIDNIPGYPGGRRRRGGCVPFVLLLLGLAGLAALVAGLRLAGQQVS